MKKIPRFLFILVILAFPFISEAQRTHKGRNYKFRFSTKFKVNEVFGVYGSIGLANYYGDLCDNFYCVQPRPGIGAGITYRFSPHFYSKSELNYLRLFSSDVWPDRNFNFRSGNLEIYTSVMYDYEAFTKNLRRRKKFSPYVFVGIGLVTYNPRTKFNGEWYTLRSYKTEGVSYGFITPIIPFGVGVKIKHTRNLDFLVEAGYRMTFTDYLDDVSSYKYVNSNQFSDPTAAALANRTTEGDNFKGYRGNPNKNDGYFVFSFKTRYTFTSKHTFKHKYQEQHRKVY